MDFELCAIGASVRVRGKRLVVDVHLNNREAGLEAVYWKSGKYATSEAHHDAYVGLNTKIIELDADAEFAGHPQPIVEVDQYLNMEQATALRDSLTAAIEKHIAICIENSGIQQFLDEVVDEDGPIMPQQEVVPQIVIPGIPDTIEAEPDTTREPSMQSDDFTKEP